MKPYYFAAELYFSNKRKREHRPGPYEGQVFFVPRKTEKDVRVRLYRPKDQKDEVLPVLFNVHGGGWVFGDAEGVDLQSQYLSNRLHCLVVNIDYVYADVKPFPYQQIEVRDTVEFFLRYADDFRIIKNKAALIGYSAGGHIAAGASILLRDHGIDLCTQVLCYPFLNFVNFDYASYVGINGIAGGIFNRFSDTVLFEYLKKDCLLLSPGEAEPDKLTGLPPAVIIACVGDPLLPQAKSYAEKLTEAGVQCEYREYEQAEHGFMERNITDAPAAIKNEPLQDTLMREAVDYILDRDIFHSLI